MGPDDRPTSSAPDTKSNLTRCTIGAFGFLSLLLLVATIAIWARSYWIGDSFRLQLPQFENPLNDDSLWAMAGKGGIVVGADRRGAWDRGVREPPWRSPHMLGFGTQSPFYPFIYNLSAQGVQGVCLGGFEFTSFRDDSLARGNGYGVVRDFYVVTPCWFWAVLLAGSVVLAARGLWR